MAVDLMGMVVNPMDIAANLLPQQKYKLAAKIKLVLININIKFTQNTITQQNTIPNTIKRKIAKYKIG
jgi:hypothetical protein